MPCRNQWITAAGDVMQMHQMTDSHVLNAYKRLEEIISETEDFDTDQFSDSMSDLEEEAERRWGPGDGEALIRERIAKGFHGSPVQPPIVGKR